VEAHDDALPLGFRRSRALVLWAGSAASAIGLVDAREIAGDPRIIDALEG